MKFLRLDNELYERKKDKYKHVINNKTLSFTDVNYSFNTFRGDRFFWDEYTLRKYIIEKI
jgi:uncharacterized pyridoxamine 5'-phosphate oxidase family protein